MEVLAVVALTGAVLYYEATKKRNQDPQDGGSDGSGNNNPGSQTIAPPITLQPPNPPIVTQPISLRPPPGNPPPPPPPLRLQPPSTSGGGGPAWNPIGGPQQPPTNPVSPGDDLPAIDGIKECSIGGFYVHGVEGDGKDFYTLWRGGDRGFGSVTDKNGKKWFLWWNQGCP